MLKIDVKDGKAEIRVTGTLGEIVEEFSHVIREVKRSVAEHGKHGDFVFTAAVLTAVLDVDEDTAIEAIKEAVTERTKSKDADDDDDTDDDEDEDEDDDSGMDEFLRELKELFD